MTEGKFERFVKGAIGVVILSSTLTFTIVTVAKPKTIESLNVPEITRVDPEIVSIDSSVEGDLLNRADLKTAKEQSMKEDQIVDTLGWSTPPPPREKHRDELSREKRGANINQIKGMNDVSVTRGVTIINGERTGGRSIYTEEEQARMKIVDSREEEEMEAFMSNEEKIKIQKEEEARRLEEQARIARENKAAEEAEMERLRQEAIRIEKEAKQGQTQVSRTQPVTQSGTSMAIPAGDRASYTYMSYSAVTSRRSAQWKTLRASGTHADNEGFWKNANGDYFIAMGTYYGKVGDRFQITLNNGTKFNAMLGDMKSDKHTKSNNMIHAKDGSIVEFIMDSRGNIPSRMRNSNGLAIPTRSKNLNLNSTIKSIVKL